LDVPGIGYIHACSATQDEGWVRAALDRYGVPYTYFADQKLREGSLRCEVRRDHLSARGREFFVAPDGIPKMRGSGAVQEVGADARTSACRIKATIFAAAWESTGSQELREVRAGGWHARSPRGRRVVPGGLRHHSPA
jgi:hypothetical protein